MNASQLTQSLTHLLQQKLSVFIWGAPGIGKSSIVKAIAKEQNIQIIDLRLALMDPTDLKGIPFFDKEQHSALWAPPSFLPKDGKGILFLDELNSAPPSVQASAYQLVLDRKVGEYTLPDGWSIVAAGNKETDRGVTYKMPAPLANRFVHLEMEISVDEWKSWAYKNKIDEKIIAYISYKNEHLFNFNENSSSKTFATPRSWEFVSSILQTKLPQELLLETISGAVSYEIAVSFLNFLQVMQKLPDIQSILEGTDTNYPKEIDVLHALSVGLISGVLQNPHTLKNVLEYSLEMQSEFSVMIVQELQKNGIDMQHSSTYKKWVKKFTYLLD